MTRPPPRPRGGISFPLAPYGDVALDELPALIDDLEAVRGSPLVVDVPVDLPVQHRRLFAALGVAVRFVDVPSETLRRRDAAPPPIDAVRDAVRDALADDDRHDALADQARAWLANA